jgi:hypothetical protein
MEGDIWTHLKSYAGIHQEWLTNTTKILNLYIRDPALIQTRHYRIRVRSLSALQSGNILTRSLFARRGSRTFNSGRLHLICIFLVFLHVTGGSPSDHQTLLFALIFCFKFALFVEVKTQGRSSRMRALHCSPIHSATGAECSECNHHHWNVKSKGD